MADTVNEKLADASIHHAIDFDRYSNGVVARLIAILNRTDPDLFGQLTSALETMPAESFTVERLEQLLYSVRSLNVQAYNQVERELSTELRNFVEYEADYQYQLFRSAIPAQVIAQVDVATVAVEQVYAAAMARPFQGRLLKEWAQSIEADRMTRIRDAVRMGYVESQTTSQIVQRIRGTRAQGYSDGIIEIDRHHAEAVVRTALSHTAGFTRDRFMKANGDLIKAVVWTATLDSRTSEGCRLRDGLEYTADDAHKPIGHAVPWLGGPGALHWNCRSISVPVTKSWKELGGVDIGEFSASTRASMDGEVPADMTYGEWLKKQSAARQDEILGKAKGALFRTGKLPLEKFYSDKGSYLTLEQLKKQQPEAFHRAGLDMPYRPPRGERKDAIATFLESKEEQQALLKKLYGSHEYPRAVATVERIKTAEGYTSSTESLAAVRYYTSNGYKPINQRMRETGGTLEDRQFSALTVSSFPGIGEFRGEIWRAPTKNIAHADAWWERAKIGEPLDLGNQLQSFSRSTEFVRIWARKADVMLHIAASKKGAYIEPLTVNPGEEEVLLPPGLEYRVIGKSVRTIDGREFRVIDLEIESGE